MESSVSLFIGIAASVEDRSTTQSTKLLSKSYRVTNRILHENQTKTRRSSLHLIDRRLDSLY